MPNRRPPTPGTFARLAVASVLACAVVPEIIDLTTAVSRSTRVAQTTVTVSAGPRVMGALHVARDDDDGRVNRFRFAAGSPFQDDMTYDDGKALAGEGAGAGAGAVEAVSVATGAEEARPNRQEPSPMARPADIIAVPQATGAIDREPVTDQPSSLPPDAVPERRAPDIAAPASAAAARPPTTPEVAPVAAPATAPVMSSAPDGTEKASRDAEPALEKSVTRRAAEPQPVTRRPAAAGGETRSRRRSAAADDDKPAPKAAWRPENLSNWPE